MTKPFPLSFAKPPRVLVVGDIMVDRYIHGAAGRLSPEAPVPVVRFERESTMFGGSGNVANNLLALGAQPVIAGRRGSDEAGDRLVDKLAAWGSHIDHLLLVDPEVQTIVKTRVIANGQQLIRVDREDCTTLAGEQLSRAQEQLHDLIPTCQAVIVSDYAKGFCVPELLRAVIETARQADIPVLVDPKGRDWIRYRGASLITPNRREAETVCENSLSSLDALQQAGRSITRDYEIDTTIITLGADGMFVFDPGQPTARLMPTQARQVFDVAGAGDTVIATLALALVSGMSLADAAHLANVAAGVVVAKPGVAVVTQGELAAHLVDEEYHAGKVLELSSLRQRLESLRADGRKIVFTNGIFDLVHNGHVQHLRQARQLGDVLVVGVNSDESLQRMRSLSQRPLMSQHDRANVLAALDCVDYVVFFDETDPVHLLETLQPDILVKGDNYALDEVVGRDLVAGYGGQVRLLPLPDELSVKDFLKGLFENRDMD